MKATEGRLLASTPSLEGIKAMIRRYYYMESNREIILHEDGRNRWNVTRATDRDDKTLPVYVLKCRSRYRLHEKP